MSCHVRHFIGGRRVFVGLLRRLLLARGWWLRGFSGPDALWPSTWRHRVDGFR